MVMLSVGAPPAMSTVMASLKTTATAAKSPALKVLLKSPVLPAVFSASDVMVGAAVSMLMVALLALLPVLPARSE